MVKAYLRYEPAAAFGVIASVGSNIAYDSSGKHLLAPALENLALWHVRQGVCTKTLAPSAASPGPSLAVTSIAASPSNLVKKLRLFSPPPPSPSSTSSFVFDFNELKLGFRICRWRVDTQMGV